MNCPFCKHSLNIPKASLSEEEFHYDCPHCSSSLLFEKEECQILSEGILPESVVSSPEADKTFVPSDISSNEETIIAGTDEEISETLLPENVSPSQKDEAFTKEENEVLTEEKNLSSEDSEDIEEAQSTDGVPSVDEKTLHKEETVQEMQENQQQEISLGEGTTEEKPPEDFSDVESFGNATGKTHQGPFYYNLLIGEINSRETREHLDSVLSDEGLNLPPVKIKDGTLKLPRLTPAAAHVIVKALLGWSLKISWEQELAVEMDEEENSDKVDSEAGSSNDKSPDTATLEEITSYDADSEEADSDKKSDEM